MFSLIRVCFYLTIFVYLTLFLLRRRKIKKLINKIPGPDGNIIFGSALEIFRFEREKIVESYTKMFESHGQFIRRWMIHQPIVSIANAEDAEVLLTSRKNIDKSIFYKLLDKWLRTGLLTSTGKKAPFPPWLHSDEFGSIYSLQILDKDLAGLAKKFSTIFHNVLKLASPDICIDRQPYLHQIVYNSRSKWFTRRKLITPAFHFSILNTFIDAIYENCNILLEKLKVEEDQLEFDIHPYLSNCALDNICETTMGVKIHAQEGNSAFAEGISEMGVVITKRMLTTWYWVDWIYYFSNSYKREQKALEILHGTTSKVIKQRIQERKTMATLLNESEEKRKPRKTKALLDLLLDISEENGGSLSDSDIREEVDTFMFEGHDTITVSTSWAIYLIGSHPDVQKKVFEELNSIFGSTERPPTRDDIQQLKYLDMVIKECLRLYPPGFAIARKLSSDLTFRNYTVPSGTTVELHIYFVHRDPKHYKNPLSFDPEHFSPENCAKRHPFAFIPFSAGFRNCIGQKFAMLEVKILLSTLFRRYKVESLQKPEDLILLAELVLRPGNGIKVRISRR